MESTNSKTIVDLDAIIPSSFEVRMGGTNYEINRGISLKKALAIFKVQSEIQDQSKEDGGFDVDKFEQMFDELSDVFRDKYPDITPEWLRDNLTWRQAMHLLAELVKELFSQEAEAGSPLPEQ